MQLHGALFPRVIALSPRESVCSNVTDVSRGKFPVLNIVNKITRNAHHINCDKLQWCFDAQGTRANHDAPFDNT